MLGLGVGIGLGVFVAANWEEIQLHIQAIRIHVEEERRKRQSEKAMIATEQRRGWTGVVAGSDYPEVSEGSDTELEGARTTGSVMNRRQIRNRTEQLFEMPSTANSSVSESHFTVYTGSSESTSELGPSEAEIVSEPPSAVLSEAELSELAMSSDDWTDAAHHS